MAETAARDAMESPPLISEIFTPGEDCGEIAAGRRWNTNDSRPAISRDHVEHHIRSEHAMLLAENNDPLKNDFDEDVVQVWLDLYEFYTRHQDKLLCPNNDLVANAFLAVLPNLHHYPQWKFVSGKIPRESWDRDYVTKMWLESGGPFVSDCHPTEWTSNANTMLRIAQKARPEAACASFCHASQHLLSDMNFMTQAVHAQPQLFRFAAHEIQRDIYFASQALSLGRDAVDHMFRRGILEDLETIAYLRSTLLLRANIDPRIEPRQLQAALANLPKDKDIQWMLRWRKLRDNSA